jgi:hypothetical protein
MIESRAVDDVVVEGAPEPLGLSVGLRAIGPGVAMLDPEFEEHLLEGMLVGMGAGGELGAVVGEDFRKGEPIDDIKRIQYLERLEHDRQSLFAGHCLGPGQA